jgi:CelD/BcsL family acetyltransferase involved in cellulose biosynthesis
LDRQVPHVWQGAEREMNARTQREPAVGSSSKVTIEALRGTNALLDLKPIWNELLTESGANTIFLTWEWAASWWHAFGSPFELLILKCSDSSGRPVGIVPFFRIRKSIGLRISGYALYLVGDVSGGSEELDWIIRDGWEQPVVAAVLDWLEGPALEWDILYYDTVRPESTVAAILVAECERRNWFLIRGERLSYRVPVSASWDAYLASISKKMRSGVQQQVRRANKTFTVQARLCQTLDQLEKDLQTLFALHAKRWQQRGKTGSLFQPEKQLFYHELARNCLAKGWLEFWMLELNGNPVACEFGFCYDGVYSFLQGGFDPDYSVYSVGVVLRASIMQSLIERGFRIYDFLLGEDDYKERWGGQRYPLLDFSFARPKSRGHRVLAAQNHIFGTINWLRTRTPKPVWAFARRAVRSVIGKK